MSDTIQQADELRGRAIALLVSERQVIDDRLKLLGYDGTAPAQPRPKSCSACGSTGHTSRTCDKKGANIAPGTESVCPSTHDGKI